MIDGTVTFYDLTIDNSHATAKVDASSSTLTIANDLTVTDGHFRSDTDINGDVSIASGATYELTNDVTIAGNFTNNGTFTHGSNTVTFDGSAAQVIDGTVAFYDLTIDNSHATAKVDASSSTLTIANDLTVTDGHFRSDTDINGDVSIASGGTYELTNDVTIAGNFTNNGTFTHGSNTVTFDGSAAQVIDGTVTFYDLVIDNGTAGSDKVDASSSTLVIANDLTVTDGHFRSDTDINGDISIASDATLELTGDVALAGNVTNNGTLTSNGNTVTFDAGSGTQTTGGSSTTTYGGLSIPSGSTLQLLGGIQIANDFTNSGTFDANSNTVIFNGGDGQVITGTVTFFNLTINNTTSGSDKVDASSSTLAITNDLTVTDGHFRSDTDVNGDVSVASGATYELTSDVTIAGNFTNNGTFTHASNTVTIGGSGAQVIDGTVTFYNLTINNSSGSAKVDASTSTLVIANDLTVTDGYFRSGTDINGDISIASDATYELTDDVTVFGSWNNNGGTFTPGTNTVTLDGTGTAEVIKSSGQSFYNLTLSGSGSQYAASDSLSITNLLNVTNSAKLTTASAFHDVDIDSGATLTAGGDMTVSGDWTNDGMFESGAFKVTFNGTGNQDFNGSTTFHDVTINSGSTVVLGDGANFAYTGTFILDGSLDGTTGAAPTITISGTGTQTLPAGLTIDNLTIAPGATLQAPSGTMTINGDITINGTFDPNGGTIVLSGDGNQQFSSNLTFFNLTIDSASSTAIITAGSGTTVTGTLTISSGVYSSASDYVNILLNGGTLSLANDITISGNFTFTSGAFTHNNFKVTFDGGTTQNLTANASGLVFYDLDASTSTVLIETVSANNVTVGNSIGGPGTIRKTQTISGTGPVDFGITQADMVVDTLGSLSSLQVDRKGVNHSSATTNLQTGVYWTISPTGTEYSVDLTLPHNATTASEARACRYTGSGTQWECDRTSSTSTTVRRDGITTLSDWAAGDPKPDLSMTKTDNNDPVVVNTASGLTYTLEVTNEGPDSASGVEVTDVLPSGIDFISYTSTQGTCAESPANTLTCDIGNIDNGDSETITLTVTPTSTGNKFNETTSISINETDPDSSNDSGTVGTSIISEAIGTDGMTFTSGWFIGTITFDTNRDGDTGDATDTINVALTSTGSTGTYDRLDLSMDDTTYLEGAATDTDVVISSNDEHVLLAEVPKQLTLGVYDFNTTFSRKPGNSGVTADVSITSTEWHTGSFTLDADADASADDTINYAISDANSDGVYDNLDLSLDDTTYGQGGALSDDEVTTSDDERITSDDNITYGPYGYLFYTQFTHDPQGTTTDAIITNITHYEGKFTFDADANATLEFPANYVYFGLSDLDSNGLYDNMDLSLSDQTFAETGAGGLADKIIVDGDDERFTIAPTDQSPRRVEVGTTYSADYDFDSNPANPTPADTDASQLLVTTGFTPLKYLGYDSWIIDADGDEVVDDHVLFVLADTDSDAVLDTMDISIGDKIFGEGSLSNGIVDYSATNNSDDERISKSSMPYTVKLGTHYFTVDFNPDVLAGSNDATISALWYTGNFSVDVNNDRSDQSVDYVQIDPNSDGLYNVIEIDLNDSGSYTSEEIFRAAGAEWTDPIVVDDTEFHGSVAGTHVSIDATDADTIYTVYYEVDQQDLLLAKSTDGGVDWTVSTIDSTGNVGQFTSIVADGTTLYVSYYDVTNTALKFAKSTDSGATWTTSTVTSTNDVGKYTSIVEADNGTLFISYFDATNGDLKVVKSTNGGTSWGSPVTVDSSGSVGQHTSIDRVDDSATDTAIYVSYQDASNGDLKMAYTFDLGTSWTTTTVDATGTVGSFTSISALNDTTSDSSRAYTVFISYYDQTNSALKVASTTDGGSTWSYVTPDSSGDVGQYTSLEANDETTVFVSYYDATNENIKFVRSTDGGATFDSPITIDATRRQGEYVALASLDTYHLFVAYFDESNGDLKFSESPLFVDSEGHRLTLAYRFDPSEASSAVAIDGWVIKVAQFKKDQYLFELPKEANAGPSANQTQIRIVAKVMDNVRPGFFEIRLDLQQISG